MSLQDSKSVRTVSTITKDGTIVELVLRPDKNETALLVGDAAGLEIVAKWDADGQHFVPVSASNNLIKHGALLLASEAIEFGSVEELVDDIESYIARFVTLPAEAYALCASYVLLTWLYDTFNELPYLRFRGDYGTGKTRALLIVGSLCYKAFFASGASTVSPIFHVLDSFKGTLVFDEADFRFSDEKAELTKILNNGNMKGFPLLRTHVSPKKEFDPRAFSIFGPKLVAMRRAFEDAALESRFLTIEMQPGQPGSVPINLPEEQKAEALALRNKLLMYRFRHRLGTVLDSSLADPRFEPRMNQILLPLLSVAPRGLHARLREKAHRLQNKTVGERAGSTEGQVLSIVAKLFFGASDEAISVGDITTEFIAAYDSDYERPISNRWIGSVLRRLGISLYKRNGVFVIAPGQAALIRVLCTRFGIVADVGKESGLPF